MHVKELERSRKASGLNMPVRNRYFYGKLLDAYHFRLETDYHNQKRWLINRFVLGYGVVCGLNVVPSEDKSAFCVTRGLAIDKWGREILVPETSRPITLPKVSEGSPQGNGEQTPNQQEEQKPEQEETWIHILLCYHECETDPTPVLVGECLSPEPCEPGAIRETYEIRWQWGKIPSIGPTIDEASPDLVTKQGIDYRELVEYITWKRGCPDMADDPCIPLANIRITDEDHCSEEDVDITVRPVCFTNDLLFHLILSHWYEPSGGKTGYK